MRGARLQKFPCFLSLLFSSPAPVNLSGAAGAGQGLGGRWIRWRIGYGKVGYTWCQKGKGEDGDEVENGREATRREGENEREGEKRKEEH